MCASQQPPTRRHVLHGGSTVAPTCIPQQPHPPVCRNGTRGHGEARLWSCVQVRTWKASWTKESTKCCAPRVTSFTLHGPGFRCITAKLRHSAARCAQPLTESRHCRRLLLCAGSTGRARWGPEQAQRVEGKRPRHKSLLQPAKARQVADRECAVPHGSQQLLDSFSLLRVLHQEEVIGCR